LTPPTGMGYCRGSVTLHAYKKRKARLSGLFCFLRSMKFTNLPRGTKLYTPTGRIARVEYIDEEARVHVKYLNGELGQYPVKLVNEADLVPVVHVR
jgi:hypothetical protein